MILQTVLSLAMGHQLGALVVLESPLEHPGINKFPSAQNRKGDCCHLQLSTVTVTKSDSEITFIVFPVWRNTEKHKKSK